MYKRFCIVWVTLGLVAGCGQGDPGLNGHDGSNGTNGLNGTDANCHVSLEHVSTLLTSHNTVTISCSDGSVINFDVPEREGNKHGKKKD